jgi:hypothetical protein
VGWIVAIFVVIALAWTAAICYELVRPGKLNWNQPSWLIPRKRPGTGPRQPRDGAGPREQPRDDRSREQPRDDGPRESRGEDRPAPR